MVSCIRNCIPSKNTFDVMLSGTGTAYLALQTALVASQNGLLPKAVVDSVPYLYGPRLLHTILDILPQSVKIGTLCAATVACALWGVSRYRAHRRDVQIAQFATFDPSDSFPKKDD